jgi:imidazolonepropionase-like amidohydrolase
MRKLTGWIIVASLGTIGCSGYTGSPGVVVYEGARLIIGDDTPPIEDGVFVVQDGRFVAVGPRSAVTLPAGALVVNLVGKTVMPAMINVHAHVGYEGYTSWGPENQTAENILDHMERASFYGTAATVSVGTSPTELSLQFQRDQRAGHFPPASQYLFMPGMAPPNGGPDRVLREATNVIGVVNEVTTPDEARAAVQRMVAQQIEHVKVWVDDRGGSYPKLTPDVYEAIIDEAHQHGMIVYAHAIRLADQKAVVAAGVDVLVHMVQREPLDEEYLALLREKRPYWATVIGLSDTPNGVCALDPFFEQALPDSLIVAIRAQTERRGLAASCGPPSEARESQMAINFPQMLEAGVRTVLATDTGIHPGHTFGSGEHVELARWVQLGMTPAEAIVAATSRPAELMGLTDLGTLGAGKRAAFIVLDANPLDDIRNTRMISDVYLDGARFDRESLLRRWQEVSARTP